MDFLMFILIGLLAMSQVVVPQDDEATLLAVSRELSLAQWGFKNSGNYCSWPGIGCGLNSSRVERLDLSHQGLQGNVSVISQLAALKSLDLSCNNFHGLVPSEFGHLYELEFLDLSFNKFGSSVPKEWGRLRNLKSLNLSNNLLTGEIPVELQGLEQLHDLQLCVNKFVGFIPDWVGSLPELRVFTAYENGFVGQIPKKLGSVSGLAVLNLHSNQLEGPIPKSIFVMGKLETLVLTQNRLTGDVPELIGKCKGLSSVRIGDNLLIGSIPKSVGNITGLTYFEADNNNLSGEIVPEFSQCANLTLLNLASNGLTGRIPRELGRLTNLQEFIVSGNSLCGEIPTAILRLKNLNKLDLSSNRINGTLPQDICTSSRLQYLLLSQNSIRGEIPREIGNCTKLLELQLGSNYLSGNIPLEISHIKNLQIAMNLSFNHLRGQLPSELGKLDKLVLLDVSNNQLSGSIPALIRGMISLIEVNLSNNQFSGPIPPFVPFQKSSNSSFSGNKGLCGEPLSSPCSNSIGSDLQSYHHSVSYRIVLTVIGSGLAVFVSVSIVVLVFMIRERQEKAAKNAGISDHIIKDPPPILAGQVFVENLQQAIDFEAVVKATMKDGNKLSSGTFSTVYKADMPSGMTLSVKRLKSVDRTIIQYQNKMIRELERLSRLVHDNLIRPIGYVICEDVALLLHQYFPTGTLARYLHDSSKQLDYEPDWPTRLHIATGVAEGLAFLHHVAVIHLDISSGNVLLDSDSNALIGEVEISKLLDPSRGFASISAVAGSFGYIPPEYAYTMQVTAPGNVYSYGVIMLEILTTRLPVDEEFGEGMDLVKWVQSSAARGETPEQILDSRLSTVSFAWRREMLAALKIALLCTDITPARRPKMRKVVELLKEVTKN